jgi:hypothetical protein
VNRPHGKNIKTLFANMIVKAMPMLDHDPEEDTLNLGKCLRTINQRIVRLHELDYQNWHNHFLSTQNS